MTSSGHKSSQPQIKVKQEKWHKAQGKSQRCWHIYVGGRVGPPDREGGPPCTATHNTHPGPDIPTCCCLLLLLLPSPLHTILTTIQTMVNFLQAFIICNKDCPSAPNMQHRSV
eukprot:scaffold4859_cov128-Isochrysis_galbana.AAC.10